MTPLPNSLTIGILGGGSWGATVADYLSGLGHRVYLWHRNREELRFMEMERRHPLMKELVFRHPIAFVSDISKLPRSEMVVVAVPSHGVREVCARSSNLLQGSTVVNLAKGIENDTLKRMSDVIVETGGVPPEAVVSLYGPSHAEEVARRIPTTVVAASTSNAAATRVQNAFSSDSFRVYTNDDLVGVELGGSVKNVIAVAAGVCDGIGYGDNTKAALITRGIVEISRLGCALGGRPETFSGLSGLGDLVVTCLSRHSRNRYVGEAIGKGQTLEDVLGGMKMVAEGVRTARSVHALLHRHHIPMPICEAVYAILFEGADARDSVKRLMTRRLRHER